MSYFNDVIIFVMTPDSSNLRPPWFMSSLLNAFTQGGTTWLYKFATITAIKKLFKWDRLNSMKLAILRWEWMTNSLIFVLWKCMRIFHPFHFFITYMGKIRQSLNEMRINMNLRQEIRNSDFELSSRIFFTLLLLKFPRVLNSSC